MAALAGLAPPPDVDGVDLSPLFQDPNPTSKPPKPNVAFSEYPRCAPPDTPWDDRSSCVKTPREHFTVMGLSVRVPDWRYTAWMYWNGTLLVPDFGREPAGVELYAHTGDMENDFDMFENEVRSLARLRACAALSLSTCVCVCVSLCVRASMCLRLCRCRELNTQLCVSVWQNVAATNKDTVEKLHAMAVTQWAHGDCSASKKPCINNHGLSCC
jgi:hypothetical protein